MGWQDGTPVATQSAQPDWMSGTPVKRAAPAATESGYSPVDNALESVGDSLKNVGMGALKGASDIGTTILSPLDYLKDKITGKTDPTLSSQVTGQKTKSSNQERREALGDFFKENADPNSNAFKVGEMGADVAGTAGVGGALAKIPAVVKYAPALAAALESGGLKLGDAGAGLSKAAEWATRVSGGAITGGASVGLINPDNAQAGAVIGGALPVAVKTVGAIGAALRPTVSDEVAALAKKARDTYKIDIPVDRIANSRPLNAVASSLNYVPLSGRTATEDMMSSQLNRAVSKTFGQDSPNITQALRRADQSLGDKFEFTLKSNKVKIDDELLSDMAKSIETAHKELGADGAGVIGRQVDEILSKAGADGSIDGQAAYNIKKTLDRLGKRADIGYYATDLKNSLMGALNRSLGPEEAQAFAKLRGQYGNMLTIENLAKNGAEGGVSAARLANLKNVRSPELQDLADIAAQFIVGRESPHGAAQRVVMGALGGAGLTAGAMAPASIPALVAGVVGGRALNTALNSNAVKSMALKPAADRIAISELPAVRSLLYNAANRGSP